MERHFRVKNEHGIKCPECDGEGYKGMFFKKICPRCEGKGKTDSCDHKWFQDSNFYTSWYQCSECGKYDHTMK